MHYNIGEKISFLYEKGGGIIRRIDDKGVIWVEDETGFDRPFRNNEIAKIQKEDYKLDDDQDISLNDDETFSSNLHYVKHENQTGRRKAMEVWEIDLHIEELVDSHAGLSNFEILSRQMSEFKSFYNRAVRKQIKKLVVIHGVGEGVLKTDIRLFLAGKENVEYHDADFREYGKGATEVIIYHNA